MCGCHRRALIVSVIGCRADRPTGRNILCRSAEAIPAGRRSWHVGGRSYARLVASSSAPVVRRRIGTSASGVVLFVAGILFDAVGVRNVPGAVISAVPGGDDQLTDLGTGLFAFVILAWVSVFWRERRPLLALIGGAVLALIGVSYVLLLIGAVRCVRQRPEWLVRLGILTGAIVLLFAVREATTSWGAALPATLASRADAQYEPAWIVASLVLAVLSLGAAAAVVFLARFRARAQRSDERAVEEHLRADALSEQMVRQAERDRIARDMHDALAHRLSVVSLHAGALEAASTDGAAGEMARTVREQARAALQDMRGLVGELRTGPAQTTPAPATLRAVGALLAELRGAGMLITAYVVIESPERASALLDGAVYRILQEAMTNAMKHASGLPVDVHLQVDPTDGARIRVVNRLTGAVASVPGGGNGLLGIRERVATLDGTAWIGPHEGSFIVDVTLPWQERG